MEQEKMEIESGKLKVFSLDFQFSIFIFHYAVMEGTGYGYHLAFGASRGSFLLSGGPGSPDPAGTGTVRHPVQTGRGTEFAGTENRLGM
jgi:hypothetical protein